MEIFQHGGSVGICGQVRFYQIAFTVNFSAVSRYNIGSRIDVINSALLPAVLIAEGYTLFRHICSSQNLSFLVNRQFTKLFLIRYCNRSNLVGYQVHVIRRSIQAVSGWCRNLFQIHRILRLDNLCYGGTIFIRCRHLCDQLCAVLITVNAKHRSSQFCVRVIGVHLNDFHLCQFQPFHRKAHIFLIFHTFSKYKGKILGIASCGNFIGRIVFRDTALHLCRPRAGHIFRLCQRGGQVKTCAAGNSYFCSCSTVLSGADIMELYPVRQIQGDRLLAGCFERNFLCPLLIVGHIGGYISIGERHFHIRNIWLSHCVIVKLLC